MQIRQILEEFNLKPRKRLGQNFLVSKYYLQKIVKSIARERADVLVEVGAGVGNLTELLLGKVGKVIAVEKDKKLFEILSHFFGQDEKVQLINDDFLKIDLERLSAKEKVKLKIVGNPPYYISSALIEKLVAEKDSYQVAFLSFQKEYLERMVAEPGNKSYGRLSIFVQSYLEVKPLFKIPKNAFYPQPEIDSFFVSLKPKEKVEVKDREFLKLLTGEFFQKRRKKIATILKNSKMFSRAEIKEVISELGINLEARPESISVEEYISLSNKLFSLWR